MDNSRIPKEAGWAPPSRLPKGPNGRALCRGCGTEVPVGRRTFCSEECVHEWKCRTDTGYQARQLLLRDKGVCRACGLDCVSLLEELKRARTQERAAMPYANHHYIHHPGYYYSLDDKLPALKARLDELGLKGNYRSLERRLWEVDHITPVVEGGGGCGLDNLRTLCWRCHRKETAALAKRRAQARRVAKSLAPTPTESPPPLPDLDR
jgi:5-methylcytosine-specific restriction protein A